MVTLGRRSRQTPWSYLNLEKSLPNMVCTGIRNMRTTIPAKHDGPISAHRSPTTAAAWRGPTHRKCRKIVTWSPTTHNNWSDTIALMHNDTTSDVPPDDAQYQQITGGPLHELQTRRVLLAYQTQTAPDRCQPLTCHTHQGANEHRLVQSSLTCCCGNGAEPHGQTFIRHCFFDSLIVQE